MNNQELIGKTVRTTTGEWVTVRDVYDNIATVNNGRYVHITKLMTSTAK